MNQDPFKEYLIQTEPDKRDKSYAWHTAIGLQAIDGLKPSKYLIDTAIQNIEGELSFDQVQQILDTYYEENPKTDKEERTEEADKVSLRIAKLLSEQAFSFTPTEYISIHKKLFTGIYETTEFLELFFRNLLCEEQNELHNRDMHVSGKYKEYKKANIEDGKVNIQERKVYNEYEKANIAVSEIYKEELIGISLKTVEHIQKIFDEFGTHNVFGRSDVQKIISLGNTRTSELLKISLEMKLIEAVSGYGKGKYKFRKKSYS